MTSDTGASSFLSWIGHSQMILQQREEQRRHLGKVRNEFARRIESIL